MAKINVSATVTKLNKQYGKVAKQPRIKIGDLPRGKLRDLAELVAPRRTVSSGCSTRSVRAASITPKRLKGAINKVAADLKANKGRDNFVQGQETNGLSKLSKELLGVETHRPAPHRPTPRPSPPARTGC